MGADDSSAEAASLATWQPKAEVRPPVGRDPSDVPQGLADMLPDWVGYGAHYLVSNAPVLSALGAIAVLFINSLR